MKKSVISILAIGMLVICLTGISQAALIDFESIAPGAYTSLDFGDAVLTSNSGQFDVTTAAPWGGMSIIDYDSFGSKLTFSSSVFDVSIFVGDYNQDEDPVFLMAYDASNNLVASDSFTLPWSLTGGDTLSVSSASAIAYVIFYSGNPYPGSLYWDNIEYTSSQSVPEPATLLLIGLGLVGLAGAKRKFQK